MKHMPMQRIKEFLSSFLSSILATIVLSIIGVKILVSWINGTLNTLLQTMQEPAPLWLTIILVLVVLLAYNRLKNLRNSYQKSDVYQIHKTLTLAINDYQEIELKPGHSFKIELKEIRKDIISYPYLVVNGKNENKEKDVAVINFDRMYPLSPGNCVKQIDENEINEGMTFSMPKYTSFSEEDVSVFSFAITNTYDDMNFFRCLVKHINSVKQEVELDVYFLRSEPSKSNENNDIAYRDRDAHY